MALPSGYKRLKYITATGSQFIDTGRVPTANTKIVMGFQLANPGTGNRCLFGVVGQFSFRWYGSGSRFRANGANNADFPTGISGTDYHTVEKTATSCTLDGSETVSTTVGSPTLSLYVMAQHIATGVSNYASGNFDVFRWYEGSTLVADYIACKSPDGIAGVWDDVNSVFLHSSGSAEFEAGPTDDPLAPHDGHNANIGNVAREIEGGTALIGGVLREIESGMTLVNGVQKEISFSGENVLANYAEGDVVWIPESGQNVEFYVAKHNYESGLNGQGRTLVVRKDIYTTSSWNYSTQNTYSSSYADGFLNSTYKGLFSSKTQELIGETTFISYGSNLLRSFFLLSLAELGLTHSYATAEGTELPIADALQIATLDGSATTQWTRTRANNAKHSAYALTGTGDVWYGSVSNYTRGVRPCFTLPDTAPFDPNTNEILET